jgi:dethiobiotin synthetase
VDSRLTAICPLRFAEPLAPAVAAERARQPIDWAAIQRSIDLMSGDSDVLIVEGVGGLMVPMDERHSVLDAIKWLELPVVVVSRPGVGTINHTALTVNALRGTSKVAGVVVNRYPAENPGVAEETNLRAIERWVRVPLLCVFPDEPSVGPPLPANIAAVAGAVDWGAFAVFG